MTVRIIHGNCLDALRELAPRSVHCVTTSPPYWGLREYKIPATVWGGDPACEHAWGDEVLADRSEAARSHGGGPRTFERGLGCWCQHCGAWRGAHGLEPTFALYVANEVAIFREVWRVLRDDGTLWLNLGDSYATGAGKVGEHQGGGDQGMRWTGGPPSRSSTLRGNGHVGGGPKMSRLPRVPLVLSAGTSSKRPAMGKHEYLSDRISVGPMSQPNRMPQPGLKPKDMTGIPWKVAQALQAPYYVGRIKSERDRVWLAAILDGEGTICGFTHERKDDGRVRTGVHVFVTNSCNAMLAECHRIWPASRHEHMVPTEGHLGTKIVNRWIPHGAETKGLLLAELYPYLISKRQQAVIGWNLLQFVQDGKRLGKSRIASEIREKRAQLASLLSDLNQDRPYVIPTWCREPPSMWEPGWFLRQDIIWHKLNPMPESIEDRCTKAHEYLFLLTKSPRYYFDAEAIKETQSENSHARMSNNHHSPSRNKLAGNGSGTKDNASFNDAMRARDVGGRNKRSVWTVQSAPFPEAHFATFPPKLIEPCILAGTSARGCCVNCGAPWRREVFKSGGTTGESWHDHTEDMTQGMTAAGGEVLRSGWFEYSVETLGWYPTCTCDGAPALPAFPKKPKTDREAQLESWRGACRQIANLRKEICDGLAGVPTRPAVVLDPFGGSGTTGLVADRAQRDAILIELNPDYAAMSHRRLTREAPLFAEVELGQAGDGGATLREAAE